MSKRARHHVKNVVRLSKAQIKRMQRFTARRCGRHRLKNLDEDVFLKKLVKMAREYRHDGDHVEVRDFVQHCFREANKTPPTDEELEPL